MPDGRQAHLSGVLRGRQGPTQAVLHAFEHTQVRRTSHSVDPRRERLSVGPSTGDLVRIRVDNNQLRHIHAGGRLALTFATG